jgi:hypothetical protein
MSQTVVNQAPAVLADPISNTDTNLILVGSAHGWPGESNGPAFAPMPCVMNDGTNLEIILVTANDGAGNIVADRASEPIGGNQQAFPFAATVTTITPVASAAFLLGLGGGAEPSTVTQVTLYATIGHGASSFGFTVTDTELWDPTTLVPPSGTDAVITGLCSPGVGGDLFVVPATGCAIDGLPPSTLGIEQTLDVYASDLTGANVFHGVTTAVVSGDVPNSPLTTTGLTTEFASGTDLTYDSSTGSLTSAAGLVYVVTLWESCGWND